MQELQFDRICNSNLKQLLASSILSGQSIFAQGRDHSLEGNLKSKFEDEFIKGTKLGQGNTGTVYKCQNRTDLMHYAVKISCSKYRVHAKDSSPRIEAKILAKLFSQNDNKYIVKYYDCWCEGKDFYLVTELCDSNIRSMGTFEEFQIKYLLRDVLKGLQFLHKKELAHMDVKPENILFKKSQVTYKLADFGISRFKEISDAEVRGGDSRYQAPEIMDNLNDRRSLDLSKTDIFSLGCVIYELMANIKIPIQKIQSFKITDQINLDNLNFSNELKSIFRQMVTRDPRNRPSADLLLQTHYLSQDIDNQIKFLESSQRFRYD